MIYYILSNPRSSTDLSLLLLLRTSLGTMEHQQYSTAVRITFETTSEQMSVKKDMLQDLLVALLETYPSVG